MNNDFLKTRKPYIEEKITEQFNRINDTDFTYMGIKVSDLSPESQQKLLAIYMHKEVSKLKSYQELLKE